MTFSIAILVISLSLDALGVGMVYELKKIKIPFISKLIICFFSIIYSGAALLSGRLLAGIMPPAASKTAGIMILLLMGIWFIIQALFKKGHSVPIRDSTIAAAGKTLLSVVLKPLGITIQIIKNPTAGDIDKSGVIEIAESLILGLALSIDAIGAGIGSGLAGFHSMVIPFLTGLFQLFFLYAGAYLGRKFALLEKLNKKAISILPGLLLILLALIKI